MRKFFLILILIPLILIVFIISPALFIDLYGNGIEGIILKIIIFTLTLGGMFIFTKLWKNQQSTSSKIILWPVMILCLYSSGGYMAISGYLVEKNKANFITEHCTETITTKTNGYTLKRCDDGTINGDGYAISEYISEGGEY